jgi:phage terminase small subunit
MSGPHAPYIFADMPMDLAVPLNAEERKFLAEYIVDLDIVEATKRAGIYKGRTYKDSSFKNLGEKLLTRTHVRAALHWLQSYRSRHSEVSAEKVIKRLWAIATADATEVSHVRIFSCRYCHGQDFQYQWINPIEFAFACRKNETENDDGGYDYDPERRPNKACPHCHGLGEQFVFVEDSRNYSPDAKLLYAGAEQTRYGIKVKTHDQMRAMDMVTKILGLYGDTDATGDNNIRIVVSGGLPD